ncbi:MAG: dethiobiotin synthase [Peptococcaceae bacterium]|nr:dethiobiotin synthase [Peptococcaceae bacterium]
MSKGLFITGTGTDVGKTYVTALLAKKLKQDGLSVAYYKAAMSGNVRNAKGKLIPGDAVQVISTAGLVQSLSTVCPYVYEHAVSPHLAAKLEGNSVDLSSVVAGYAELCAHYDAVLMEGAGGILCPLRNDAEEKLWTVDLIRDCHLNCLLVADAGLGAINAVGFI